MQQEPSLKEPVEFGKFQLVRRIGAGGMGEVFLARDESGQVPRACVVKKVLPHLSQNRAFVGRFVDESKVVVRLRHPQVARVYAMGEVNGEYFLAMEYVQGKTVSRFARRLRERKQVMPFGLVLLIGERMCQGLAYAHKAQDEGGQPLHLVHRDLSPANVCVSYRGEVKIIDFGAAQSTLKEEQTAPRVVIGNLTYMAPEQAKKQIVDCRADVYSVGVCLWELLAWHALPQRGDPIERWRKAANPSWEPPSRHRPGVPPEVDLAILKALRKDPGERYPDAATLGAELARLRAKYAPDANEKELAALLSHAFNEEKLTEEGLLARLLGGSPITEVETDKKTMVVPPTALAFEHRALHAPVDFVPDDDEVTDPTGTPTPARRPGLEAVNPTRVAFAIPFAGLTDPAVERSIVDEIEAVVSAEEEYHTAPYDTPGHKRWLLLCVMVFLLASGVGFAGIWLWELFANRW
ncbi:MAG: serine/threonine protein kinase [Myxococcales bacterium]|nr:serine/threonine protein kinase [Myxococcales bacterium]